MMKTFTTLMALSFGLNSCNYHAVLTETEIVKMNAEIYVTLQNYCRDIAKYGLTAEFKYLDSSQEFFWVPPGYGCAISYDSVSTILNQNASKFVSINNTFDTLQIIPLSQNLATYNGRIHSAMTDTTGKVITLTLIETGVVIKRDGGWKLLHGQTSVLNE